MLMIFLLDSSYKVSLKRGGNFISLCDTLFLSLATGTSRRLGPWPWPWPRPWPWPPTNDRRTKDGTWYAAEGPTSSPRTYGTTRTRNGMESIVGACMCWLTNYCFGHANSVLCAFINSEACMCQLQQVAVVFLTMAGFLKGCCSSRFYW